MKDREFPRTAPLYVIGAVLTLLGCLAFATPSVAGKWVVAMLGVVLLIAGIIQLIAGWWAERLSQRISPMIIGLVSTVSGAGLLAHPLIGSEMVILVMSIFFVASGIWKVVNAFSYRPAKGWLCLFISGVIACALGYWMYMYRQAPEQDLKIIGFLAGLDFLLTGMSVLAVAITVRQLMAVVQNAAEQVTDTPQPDQPLVD